MDFTKLDGLVPAVIQDDVSNEVLMVGFMNQEALDRTVATGFATFFSRTRGKLWMKGQRAHLAGDTGGSRAGSAREWRKRRLIRNRHRIVNERADAAVGQMRLEPVPVRREYREQVIHVPRIAFRRHRDCRARERVAIGGRERPASSRPRRHQRQARPQHGRLYFVEPAGDAELHVPVAFGLAAVA